MSLSIPKYTDEEYLKKKYQDGYGQNLNGINPFGGGFQLPEDGNSSGWGSQYGVSDSTSVFDVPEGSGTTKQPALFASSGGASTVSDGVKTDPMSMGGSLFNMPGVTDNPNVTVPILSVPGAGNTPVGLPPSSGSEHSGGSGTSTGNQNGQQNGRPRFDASQMLALSGGLPVKQYPNNPPTVSDATTGEGTLSVGDKNNPDKPADKGVGDKPSDNSNDIDNNSNTNGNNDVNNDIPEDNPDKSTPSDNDKSNDDSDSINKQEENARAKAEEEARRKEAEERRARESQQAAA